MATIEEIKRHLGNGDYARIGKKLGITRKYARVLLTRPKAKLYYKALKAAEEIANFNASLNP